ncbi:MAG: hemerythrin domain-containing protein [Syntrophales bacterium]|nr:hemerythrin domain-containing protein [Syntrophales bacterium]
MKTQKRWISLITIFVFAAAAAGLAVAQQTDRQKMDQAQAGADQTIYDILQKEHNEVKDLLKRIGDSKDPRQTSQLMAQLRSALVPHMRAEEKVVYPALMKDENAKSLALQAQKEHKAAQKVLQDMSRMRRNDAKWQAGFNMLNQSLNTHIENEEGPLFDQAKNVWNDQQARQIAQQYMAAKKQAGAQPRGAKGGKGKGM